MKATQAALAALAACWVCGGLVCGRWLALHQAREGGAASREGSEASSASSGAVDDGLFDVRCAGARCVRAALGLRETLAVHVYASGAEDDRAQWRFRHLLGQGLAAHPSVDVVVDGAHHADIVLWLPQWSRKAPVHLRDARRRLVVLDEHDDRERPGRREGDATVSVPNACVLEAGSTV